MDNTQPKGGSGNLLVVDDDLFTRQTMEAFLTRHGYEVRCAPNGETALMFAREDPPELILLDIRLPDLDGFQVCRRLKEDQETSQIPVIFISGLEETVDKVKGFAAGGVDYVTKPFQAEELLARVETHLALRRFQKQIEAQNVRLQRAHDELEDRVKERTLDLAISNEQLFASEKALEERLQFETLLAEISGRFVNMPLDRIDDEIKEVLYQVREFLHFDRSTLWVVPEEDRETMVIAYIDPAQENPALPARMDARDFYPWSLQKLMAEEILRISNIEDLPPEAAWDRETWRLYGTKSTAVLPLSTGGKVFGVLSFAMMSQLQDWPEMLVKRLELIAQLFGNVFARKRAEEELKKSYIEINELKDRLQAESTYLQEEIKLIVEHTEIVGQSLGMKKVLAQAEQVARTESTVLILGETGTGKELLARAIHRMSARKERPLVTVNCASLPPTLIESELFGRERGAYTGALTKMIGRFEVADGSTLFLDEIGEIPLELQTKLLRILETGNFERLGSTKSIHVDVRIITATNRDISQDVIEGKFRKDLFYRLNVFPIVIPPLRERQEDIPLMVWAFVREFEKKMGKEIENIPKKSMQALQSYSWPGNVRELRNVVERAMIVSRGGSLVIRLADQPSSETPGGGNLEDMERKYIVNILEKTAWRIGGKGGAAEALGLKRSTLYSKMNKLGIKLKRPI